MSRAVQAEYHRVLGSAEVLTRNLAITQETLELVLRRLRYVGQDVGHTRASFPLDRDPKDESFIELAIDGRASHLVTRDKDLLSLASGHDDAAKRIRQRLPGIHVLRPVDFLQEFDAAGP